MPNTEKAHARGLVNPKVAETAASKSLRPGTSQPGIFRNAKHRPQCP